MLRGKGVTLLKLLLVLTLAVGFLVADQGSVRAQAPTISVSPISGPAGTTVTVAGSNFASGESITITFDGTPVTSAATGAAPATSWSASYTIPATYGGPHTIRAYGPAEAASPPSATFTITPTVSVNRFSGPANTPVSVTGSGFAPNESITITFDGTSAGTGVSASLQGSWSTSFNVPASPGGSHTIGVTGSTTAGIPVQSFTVTPTVALSRSSGSPGASVNVFGSGFGANETGITITYDGTAVASAITASATGSWSALFNVPASAGGSHNITISGSFTQASYIPGLSFTVTATLSINKTSGSPGTSLTVSGTGFGASETGITVTYDSATVASSISASTTGAWTATFNAPTSAAGSHAINAFGSATAQGTAAPVTFTIGAGISTNRISGTVGTAIAVSGTGFGASETGIVITYDSTTVASGISANSSGSWTANFNAPASAAGAHAISAYGSFTASGTVSAVSFSISPSISINKTGGSPGTSVTVSGSGFGSGETGIIVTYDGNPAAPAVLANSTGTWSATFNVPASASGPHSVAASGAATSASSVSALSFNITPGISVNRSNGAVGASLTVSGSGFNAGETGITVTYNGTLAVSGISANQTGSWSSTFTVPASASGSHTIDASGAATQAADVPDLNFTVNPSVSANKTGGSAGTPITVTGSGFGANETGISVAYDGTTVASGISASPAGSWSTTFNVPASASGSHAMNVAGATTPSAGVPALSFLVGASISGSRTSGVVGSAVTVTGSGFGANETGISITFEGTPVVVGISASQQGSWSNSFSVPASTSGAHVIDAYGSSTQAGNVPDLSFTISPSLSVSPGAGYVGIKVEVAGSGFAANSRVPVTYDGVETAEAVTTTNAAGSFSATIAIPKSKGGPHTIKVVDSSRGQAEAAFAMETTPPPVPSLVSPNNGDRIGLLGGITPTFSWSNVEDPSGVTYALQIDTVAEFSKPLFDNSKLSTSKYSVAKDKALPRGTYYWRVKAVDGASNESAWSEPWALQAGLMDLWALILIIVLCVGILAGAAYFFFVRRPRWRRAPAVAEGEVAAAPPVYVRVFEPEQTGRLGPTAPPRKLLAQAPAGRPKSAEEAPATEEHARAKMTVEFARSLPLVQPAFNVDWLVELVQQSRGPLDKMEAYRQLIMGEPVMNYEPAWRKHPLYPDMVQALQGQPVLDDLDDFVDAASRCASECLVLLQDVYRDTLAEIPEDVLENGGLPFVFGVYADALGWFRGKFLRQPSEQDYVVKTESSEVGSGICWLNGQDNTPFAGPLIQALDNKQAFVYRDLHLGLRRNYRQGEKAKAVVEMIVQLDMLRGKLTRTLSRVATSYDTPERG